MEKLERFLFILRYIFMIYDIHETLTWNRLLLENKDRVTHCRQINRNGRNFCVRAHNCYQNLNLKTRLTNYMGVSQIPSVSGPDSPITFYFRSFSLLVLFWTINLFYDSKYNICWFYWETDFWYFSAFFFSIVQ